MARFGAKTIASFKKWTQHGLVPGAVSGHRGPVEARMDPTNQLLVATDRDTALYGPLGTDGMFWHQWKETFPQNRADVETRRATRL